MNPVRFSLGKNGMRKYYCPTCNCAFDPEKTPVMPFCGTRCREIDLGRWLEESYAVPVDLETEPESEKPADIDDSEDE